MKYDLRMFFFPLLIAATVILSAGWCSQVARQNHSLEVVGSNPTPATNLGPAGTPSLPCQARALPGLASWEQFDEAGRRGAYGIAYDPLAMTCAKRGWPTGTLLRVTERHNGLSVVVRVTDRNPARDYRRGVLVDLSAAAFAALAGRELGVAEVNIQQE